MLEKLCRRQVSGTAELGRLGNHWALAFDSLSEDHIGYLRSAFAADDFDAERKSPNQAGRREGALNVKSTLKLFNVLGK